MPEIRSTLLKGFCRMAAFKLSKCSSVPRPRYCGPFLLAWILLFSSSWSVSAQENTSKTVNFIGYASYEFGEIVNGSWAGGSAPMDHYWSHQVFAGIGFDAKVRENFDLIARVEGKMWNTYPGGGYQRQWHIRNFSLWLDQAQGTYTFCPWFSITGGYFVYKYNPQVRDLGEFLFRSFTYPGIIMNYFDFPANRLLGFRFNSKFSFFDDLIECKNDLFALEETDQWPFSDISFAYVGSCAFAKILDIGAGIDLAHFIAINKNNFGSLATQHDSATNRIVDHIDTTTHTPVYGDGFYTFKATKVMGRATIDPKPIFGSLDIFGSEDLKLYGEITVIGLDDYSYWYDDITKRIPIMFGLNIPTFKFMDVLALEFEHYAFPFIPSYKLIETGGIPLPTESAGSWDPEATKANHWKWALYMKKTVFPGLSLTVQLARDHVRPNYSDGFPMYDEALITPKHWGWIAKLTGNL